MTSRKHSDTPIVKKSSHWPFSYHTKWRTSSIFLFCPFSCKNNWHKLRKVYWIWHWSIDSQIDKPQRGRPKRAELPDVNINTGVQLILRASLSTFAGFKSKSFKAKPKVWYYCQLQSSTPTDSDCFTPSTKPSSYVITFLVRRPLRARCWRFYLFQPVTFSWNRHWLPRWYILTYYTHLPCLVIIT